MVVSTFTDDELLCVEQQVLLREKDAPDELFGDNKLKRTRAALHREYQRKTISTQKFVELSRRLNTLWENLNN